MRKYKFYVKNFSPNMRIVICFFQLPNMGLVRNTLFGIDI